MEMKRVLKIIILTIFVIYSSGLVNIAIAFRDTTPSVKKATEKFSEDGMFGPFMYKFGRDLFRPDGNVSRSDLILLISEYHILTQKLFRSNRRILSRLNKMDTTRSQGMDTDAMIREFQKVLDPMLEGSETIKELRELRGVTSVRDRKTPDREFKALKNEVKVLSNMSGDSLRGVKNIEERLARLEKKLKTVTSAKDVKLVSGASEEEVDSLRSEIKELRKSMNKLARSRGKGTSVMAEGFPFWARVSMGVSVVALFFMSR